MTHGITAVLVASVDTPNDEYIAAASRDYPWCHPAAFFHPSTLSVGALEALGREHGEGTFQAIAMYLGAGDNEALLGVDSEVWEWLGSRKWLISCNDSGEGWLGWAGSVSQLLSIGVLYRDSFSWDFP